MQCDYTLRDSYENLTVLYYKGCGKGFKFFGDDPEEYRHYIKQEHLDMMKEMFAREYKEFPVDYMLRFYMHSRCLVFPDGIWMSETAKYPQYLRYRPGTNLSFRVSGITRFTSLTENSSAICIGADPEADQIPLLRRLVHKCSGSTMFMPLSTSSILVPTENCTYGDLKIDMGHPVIATHEFDELVFEQPGYLIEFMKEPMTLEEELVNYCHQWLSKDIEVFER